MASGRKILVITQWKYNDALIQAYTLPYIHIINNVGPNICYLVCVKDEGDIAIAEKDGVTVIELPVNKDRIFSSWFRNITALNKVIKQEAINVIHPWCTPAAAVGLVLKWLNRSVQYNIDSFEPHAEAMVENKAWSRSGLKYKVLSYFERKEAKTAGHLIFAAEGMENYIASRYGIEVKNYYAKPACVDLNEFGKELLKDAAMLDKLQLKGKVVGMYAGKFGGIYMEEETFEFIKCCMDYWGADKFRFLLLSNVDDAYVNEMSRKHGIANDIIVKRFVPHNEVGMYMGQADFAICPVKPVPTKRYCSPIKDGEYWALGLPVVITLNISNDSDIIAKHKAGAIIETLDKAGYLKAIEQIDTIISGKSRDEVYAQIRPLAEKYRNFSIAEKIYRELYQ